MRRGPASFCFLLLTPALVLVSLLAGALPACGALSWEFNTDGNAQGWDGSWVNDLARPFTVSGGMLSAQITGTDPYLCSSTLSASTAELPAAHVRMRVSLGGGMLAALYWAPQAEWSFSEDRTAKFFVVPDGQWRDYLIPLRQYSTWTGTIARLRLDPPEHGWPATVDVDFIRLGEGVVASLSCPQSVALAGEPAALSCRVVNAGPTTVEHVSVSLAAPAGCVTAEPTTRMIGDLAAGAETTVTWHVTAPAVGAYLCRAYLARPGAMSSVETTFRARAAAPSLSPERPVGAQAYLANGHAVLENENLRLVFPQTDGVYDCCVIFAWTEAGWRRVGAMAPLAYLAYRGNDGATRALAVGASTCAPQNGAQASLRFEHSVVDADGIVWSLTTTYGTAPGDHTAAMQHRAVPSAWRSLAHFSGPIVYAGDGAYGETKETAILAGLEWLESGERSSTDLDITTWERYRIVPHGYKLTTGAMGVAGDGCLVGLIWDPRVPWDGIHVSPAARFASPNWIEGQANHLMQVFAPSVPSYVMENGLYAVNPPYVGPSTPVTLETRLVVEPGTDAAAVEEYWLSAYGPAQPSTMPRSIAQEIALCRTGFDTLWDPASGWSHALGWGHEPSAGFAALHWIDYLNSTDPTTRAALSQRVDDALTLMMAWWGEGGVANLSGCHIVDWPLPFFKGHLDGALDSIASQASSIRASQQADGSWRWSGGALGQPGETAIGLCASNAMRLLRHARLTKDRTSLASGLKALRFMDGFVVPRGAQTWEVPLHTPDILASGCAVGAYLEGYRITGDPHYLERAVYWARTGLPFVYFWQAADRRPAMYGATIPVFGATQWTWPWLGRAVQWCGLVYGFYLNRLAGYDDSMDWRAIADSIAVSGTHQQRADGLYPDVFSLLDNQYYPVYINPEDIVKNVWWMLGVDPEVKTAVVRHGGAAVHLSTQAIVDAAGLEPIGNDTRLTATLTYAVGETGYALIAGMRSPSSVKADGRTLSSAADVDSVAEGWQYTAAGLLIIKAVHVAATAVHEVTSPDSIPPGPPGNLQAIAYVDRVVLSWQANTEPDLSRYLIYRASASGGPYAYIGYRSKGTTTYTDYLSSQGVTYYYVVTARDTGLNESAYSNQAAATPGDTTPPGAVTDLTASAGESSVALAWANPSVDFASTTIVHRPDRFPAAIGDGTTIYQGTGSAYTHAGLATGTPAYYAAIACDAHGNCAAAVTAEAMPYQTVGSAVLDAGWQLISLPWTPADPDPDVVFAPNPVDGRLYRYDRGVNSYLGYFAASPGEFGECERCVGYWLYLEESSALAYAALPEWSLQTIALPARGWHLIGHPWAAEAALERCLVRDTATGEVMALNDADAAHWLSLPMYYWDGAGGYGRCGGMWPDEDTLAPWRGYWLYTNRALDLIIPPPQQPTAGLSPVSAKPNDARGSQRRNR